MKERAVPRWSLKNFKAIFSADNDLLSPFSKNRFSKQSLISSITLSHVVVVNLGENDYIVKSRYLFTLFEKIIKRKFNSFQALSLVISRRILHLLKLQKGHNASYRNAHSAEYSKERRRVVTGGWRKNRCATHTHARVRRTCRGSLLPCSGGRACPKLRDACLRSPLFTISMLQSAMTATTVISYTYSIPMRNSVAGWIRSRIRDNEPRWQASTFGERHGHFLYVLL